MSELDRTSHLPLALQIATVLRYRIATGLIGAGSLLPSYRVAALEWGVNLHTVRRAYLELAKTGLVRIDDRRGAIVLDHQGSSPTGALDQFAREVLDTAEQRFGATGRMLLAALRRQVDGRVPLPPVLMLECSWTLSRSLAEQVRSAWAVDARGWLSTRAGEAPPGTLITTYFHFDELRRLLPSRADDLEVIHIRPSLALLDGLRARLTGGDVRRIVLLDTESEFAHGITPDLRHYLGSQVEFEVRTPQMESAGRRKRRSGELFLVSPRDWDRLGPSFRRRSDVLPLTYDCDEQELARLAKRRGWNRAGEGIARPSTGGRSRKSVG